MEGRGHGGGQDSSENMQRISRRTQWDPRGAEGGDMLHPDEEGAAREPAGKPGQRGGGDAKQEGFKEGVNDSVKCCQETKQDKT